MTAPQPYLALPGTAREALAFYADVFGGEVSLSTFEQFNRSDGPADAIAHGELSGPVGLAASDTTAEEQALSVEVCDSHCWAPTSPTPCGSGSLAWLTKAPS
ncbi:MAG: hypothetical protein WA892_04800 [Ornithinimicrobium sp.]